MGNHSKPFSFQGFLAAMQGVLFVFVKSRSNRTLSPAIPCGVGAATQDCYFVEMDLEVEK